MLDSEAPTSEEVRAVAQEVLAIERTVLRRAWGVLFALAAIGILVEAILPEVLFQLGLSTWYTTWVGLAVNTVVSVLGLVTAVWIFRRVYAMRFVRSAITGSFWAKIVGPLPALAIFVLSYAFIIAVLEFFTSYFYTILFGSEVAGIPLFYYGLRASFPEGLPREGVVSLAAASVFSIGTLITLQSPFVTDVIVYLALWTGTVVVFVIAFVHSRSAKFPEPREADTDW